MNRQIRRLAAGLLACYVVLFVQLNVLQVGKDEELRGDIRNNREVIKEFNQPRGQIVSSDGVVIARSVPTDDGFDFQREYPTEDLFANVTGYYSFAFGATQLERVSNGILTGSDIRQQLGGLPDLLDGESDNSGSVRVTLRSDLQAKARELLGTREGSVVMIDTRTGGVLAMYSWPSFDPNDIAVHNTAQAEEVLTFLDSLPEKPLLANAYQERYMPGSTYKVVTTTAALESGTVTLDEVFPDEREYTPPLTTDPIQNYGGSVCGGDFPTVFARSCNTPFARLAVEMGPETMVAQAEAFGLNEAPPFDLPRPAASNFGAVEDFVDNTPLLAIRGFGQNDVAITPLQMAMIAGSVANGGRMMQPYVIDSTYDHDGRLLDRTQPEVWRVPMRPDTAATLTQLMVKVANEGTARCCIGLENGIQAAAKTGTAQLNNTGEPERSHAWIMAFAPAEAPRIAVAVMFKGVNDEISASTGGQLAGPVAKQMLDLGLLVVPT